MRRKALYVVIAALSIASIAFSQEQDENAKAVAEIKKLSREGQAAHMRGDRKGVEALLASDYTRVFSDDTKATRQQQLAKLGRCGVASLKILDQDIRVYGNTAVETTLAELTLKDKAKGKTKALYTAVWVKRDDRWQVVQFHH